AIEPEQSRSYGIVAGTPFGDRLLKLDGIVEKPAPQDAPSNMGVVGRYILTPSIFKHLRAIRPGAGGELQLTDAIASLLREELVLSHQFEGTRYDCGSKQGYLQATVQFALKHPEVRDEFRAFLDELASNGNIPVNQATPAATVPDSTIEYMQKLSTSALTQRPHGYSRMLLLYNLRIPIRRYSRNYRSCRRTSLSPALPAISAPIPALNY